MFSHSGPVKQRKRWFKCYKIILASAADCLAPVCYGRNSSHMEHQGFSYNWTTRKNTADLTHKTTIIKFPFPLSTNKSSTPKTISDGVHVMAGCEKKPQWICLLSSWVDDVLYEDWPWDRSDHYFLSVEVLWREGFPHMQHKQEMPNVMFTHCAWSGSTGWIFIIESFYTAL